MFVERHMNVGAGKYTVGLGQEELSVYGDREDIQSMCLSGTLRIAGGGGGCMMHDA